MKNLEDSPGFDQYQEYKKLFNVNRDMISAALKRNTKLATEALYTYAQAHLWRDELPVFAVMTTPEKNGGWGHLMPLWFKPHERPIPYYTLENWALFALIFRHSFGRSQEAEKLVEQVFNVDTLVRVVAGTNLLLPFLPSTQGRGYFFRHGLLPFLLAILWLEEEARAAWLRLHALGADRFIDKHKLAASEDPLITISQKEHTIFSHLERNTVSSAEAVADFLSESNGHGTASGTESLLDLYQDMFGAINLGITALAAHYAKKPLDAWREWFFQEISFPYRLPEFGEDALHALIKGDH